MKAKWSTPDETGVRSFLPYGNAPRVRFYLLDSDGNEVDRCGVANTPAAIEATFKELCKQAGKGTFTYRLGSAL